MLAQSKSTAVISENIANISTVGYKSSRSAFQEMVSSVSRGTFSSSADRTSGVSQFSFNNITNQGSIQQTSSGTDAAITGRGFFTVASTTNANGEFLYTRAGAFQEDANGILRNTAGFVLYGVQTDGQGNVIGDITNSSSFVPIDVTTLLTQSAPTSNIEMSLNLDAEADLIDPHALTPSQSLPVSAEGATFVRNVLVYDNTGIERQLNFEFRRTIGPMAHFRSDMGIGGLEFTDVLVNNASGPTPGIANGDVFNISNGTTNFPVTFINAPADTSLDQAQTVADLMNVINNFIDPGTGEQAFVARLDQGNLLIQSVDTNATLDISASAGVVLGATGLNIILDPVDSNYTYAPETDMIAGGPANPNQSEFPDLANSTTPNAFNWWEMSINTIDPADPSGSTLVEISKGLINFDGSGNLNMTPNASGDMILNLSSINFDNALGGEEIDIEFNMTAFTQFSGGSNVIFSQQDGAPIGSRTDIRIDNDGTVFSLFNNGIVIPIYQIPLAVFSNANGMDRVSGTAFRANEKSGEVSYLEAGTQGAGNIASSSLENANVDVANEFGHLIVSQRAYSMNSQIITAANEMAQTLTRLK